MRPAEARKIAEFVSRMDIDSDFECLNIGSSTRQFRELDKPHVNEELIRPLEKIGVRFVHVDIKSGPGIDMVGDVLDANFQAKLRSRRARLILCCNLLEHLSDPFEFARSCVSLVRPGGTIVVSVPFSFPMHNDPIDNMLRPTPEEIGEMFPGCRIRDHEIVESGSYLNDLLDRADWPTVLARTVGAILFPFLSKGAWRPRAHRLLWLLRRYRISVAVLEKLEIGDDALADSKRKKNWTKV